MALSQKVDGNIDPASQIAIGGSTRYPNQFFDLSQQYMPPTIKELFRWCTFYYYNSPLIGSTIKKISRYPITDLILDDKNDKVRDLWEEILVKGMKMKDRLMEINLDLHVYGNCFVSLHLPFTRYLQCSMCKRKEPIKQWRWRFDTGSYSFRVDCKGCHTNSAAIVDDRPYKDRKAVKLIRWNAENIHIKHNDYTGRTIYLYSVPYKLKNAILRGDKDILEDIPMIVLQAVKNRRYIRFNSDNLFHIKQPTLAEQDMGWGKPAIIHVLKDMFYLYTLRRAQEAIALEHVVPFDIIYPLPNAQVDPYVHTDLASWRNQIEDVVKKHRRDPNFKAVIPIPVGFGRLGGDGKAMMLTPELNYLNQTIVGGMGVPQEFLFGGLNYTGSSISLRTLENDFIQARSQLCDCVHWIKDKLRIWLSLPNLRDIRFADFRMADDVQKNQQIVGLNAQGKLSDQTMLTELGYDYDHEIKKLIEEVYIQNYLNDLRSKGAAKSQGESQIVQFNYGQKVQELASKAQENVNKRLAEQGMLPAPGQDPNQPGWAQAQQGVQFSQGAGDSQDAGTGGGGQAPAAPSPLPSGSQGAPAPQVQQPQQPGAAPAGVGAPAAKPALDLDAMVSKWATKLQSMDPAQAALAIGQVKAKDPALGARIEQAYKAGPANAQAGGAQDPLMKPAPTQKPPRRQGGMA